MGYGGTGGHSRLSLVEVVEAFTIVLATVRGWRPAMSDTVAALALLALTVAGLGPVLDRIPLHWRPIKACLSPHRIWDQRTR